MQNEQGVSCGASVKLDNQKVDAAVYWVALGISLFLSLGILMFTDVKDFLFGGVGQAIVILLNGAGMFAFIAYAFGAPQE